MAQGDARAGIGLDLQAAPACEILAEIGAVVAVALQFAPFDRLESALRADGFLLEAARRACGAGETEGGTMPWQVMAVRKHPVSLPLLPRIVLLSVEDAVAADGRAVEFGQMAEVRAVDYRVAVHDEIAQADGAMPAAADMHRQRVHAFMQEACQVVGQIAVALAEICLRRLEDSVAAEADTVHPCLRPAEAANINPWSAKSCVNIEKTAEADGVSGELCGLSNPDCPMPVCLAGKSCLEGGRFAPVALCAGLILDLHLPRIA